MSRLSILNPDWRCLLIPGLLLAAGGLLGLISGCTSDPPNAVGLSQVETEIDVVLEPLTLEGYTAYKPVIVRDDEVSLGQQEVLYLGSQGGNTSSILLNFDFSDVYSDSFPESAWNLDNIEQVELRLVMLSHYGNLFEEEEEEGKSRSADKSIAKVYEVYELDEPFSAADYPDFEPDSGFSNLNIEAELTEAKQPRMRMPASFLLDWVADGGVQGLTVREGSGSLPGISGFASNELNNFGELDNINAEPGAMPVILVEFAHTDSVFYLEPSADCSTFHQLSEAPADLTDGMMLRTCLRSYPMLRFDFSSLPENAYVNRAVLSVTNDTTSSFGALEAIVVSEIDVELVPDPGDTLLLSNLEDAVYSISGMVNLDPTFNERMEFNVTTAVHRIVNGVYDGERGFILTAGEDFFPGFDITSIDPDFYLNQFNFFGTSAADSLRPRLRISYSIVEDIAGGEE